MTLKDLALILSCIVSIISIMTVIFCLFKLYFDHEVRLKLVESSDSHHSNLFTEIKSKLESIMDFIHKLEINQVKSSRSKSEEKQN